MENGANKDSHLETPERDPIAELDTLSLFSHVLLIEDEPAHDRLVTRALKGIVGEVSHAASGEEAIAVLNSSLPELVLCDLHLPDISGVDLLGAMKAIRPGLPVIVMTSSSNLDDAVSAMREGASDYMVKQFSEDFKSRISLVIQRLAEQQHRQLREIQVRAERDAFWAAVHTAKDGLAILGPEGNVVFANEAFDNFCALVGDDCNSQSRSISSLVEQVDKSVAQELQAKLGSQSNDSLWSAELQVPTKNAKGEESCSFFELSLTSVQRDIGDIEIGSEARAMLKRHVVWVHDITRKKEQERFQRDLLSTTSHDLKGPLGAILTSAELISEGTKLEPEKVNELITRIASCARNSITIIDELLSARRIQDGVLVVKPHLYDVADFLEDTVLDYLPMAKAKKLAFSHRALEPGLKVFADRIGLTRILGNLVSNAIKFTPSGGKVELAAERRGKEVRISVTDTGSGIEAKARHMLFTRYARLDKHQEIEGTGLGLFVTKNIVAAHNGRIEVQSEVGVGSTFTVVFPDQPEQAVSADRKSEIN